MIVKVDHCRELPTFAVSLCGRAGLPDRSSSKFLRCGQAAYVRVALLPDYLPEFSLPNVRLTFRVAVRRASREARAVSVLHHLAIGTRDVARLARFYIDVLGLREVTRHLHADGSLRSVWLDLGGSLLMIEPTDEPPRTVVGVGAGPFLIAVAVSVDERSALETRLAGAGSNIELRSEFTSYARDPDGNRIALSAFPLGLLEQA